MSQTLNLTALQKAIVSLEELHKRVCDANFMAQQDSVVRLGLQAGLIKNLEFTYELCWKAMKRWLELNAGAQTDGITRRELFRIAAENRLIADVEEWMLFHALRNQTAHRYDSQLLENTQPLMDDFIRAAHALLVYLQAHHD